MRIRSAPISRSLFTLLATMMLALAYSACSSTSDSPSDSGKDAGPLSDGGLLDPAHDKCTQPGSKGNNLKVGMYCSKSGGECDYNDVGKGEAYLCTLDQEPTAPLAMCTKQCFINSECGDDAVCTGDGDDKCSTRKGCVPKACTDDPGLEDASECEHADGGM